MKTAALVLAAISAFSLPLAAEEIGCATTTWKNAGVTQIKNVNFWPDAE
ncbi:MAG: hypothetical protein IV101_08335 [Dechloromonas sp.]|nr:hypothetical protein [Dechloromonas sp.]MBT9520892.1 hypothetical protein [Dechloromonas sp.]